MRAPLREESLVPEIEYDNAKTLMAQGPQALHDHVASRMEKALGTELPQMEVRFQNVSISSDIVVKDKENMTAELPTLPNVLKTSLRELQSKKHVVTKQILKNVSGVFKPGTITLILGQPGSGKSSLLKLLSGRFPKNGVAIEGQVTYNGISSSDLHKNLPQLVSYVAQRDKHHPILTVKETLEFAHACSGGGITKQEEEQFMNEPSSEGKAALEASRAMFKHHPGIIIQQLGLENCQGTIVGDEMVRGVSGGERKRTTTGEMAFGSKYVMMMDEISTGLDSAATFNIISTQRSIARRFRKTVVMSLLQPSPEVFGLFDDVILMNEGQIMYNGPCDEVLSYFNSLGLKCPPHRDTADFLLDLGTFNQSQYESAVHHGLTIPQTPDEFAETFKQSLFYRRVLEDLEGPICTGACNNPSDHPEFHQNNWNSTKLLMKRQIQIMRRESSALIGRLVMNIVMGLLYATVFYQFNDSDAQLAMGIIFESVLTLSLAQSAQIPTIMAEREVFYKQRGANFFQTGAYVLSSSICQMPQIILETVVFGSIVYWMCGFVSTLGSFIFFLTMLCLTNIAFAAFFFFLGSVAPDLNIANPISSVTVLFFVLFAGFTVTKGQIPDYLVWLYWINPMGWGVRALAVNQYSDEHFNRCEYGGVDYCADYGMTMGRYSLNSFEVPTEKYWLWYGMIYMGAAYVLFMFLSFIALEYHRFERPENVTLKLTNLDEATGNYTLSQTPRHPPTEYEEVITVGHSVEKQFVPVTVAFKNLWYSVPDPQDPKKTIDLLKGISGYALPGTITALMGSSGAGKTTLMDVIAGRKTKGKIEGEILLNGHPATDLAIRRSTGYCEQMDIHSASSTIREALTFSAFLRQGADVPASAKYESVNECLDLLDLHPIADQIIRSSSVEQMKRLTIGVEMAAQPSVLFLDEPTSGLDARSAKLIMDGVRKVANTGRTVICTIHQPSTEVFRVFDSLLLLKRGGQLVYVGDLGSNSHKMIQYFESINGVMKLPDNYNPATWMLEVIGAGVSSNNGTNVMTDFAEIFQSSDCFQCLMANLDREGVCRPSPLTRALEFDNKRAASETTQATFLLKRFFNLYWRTASFTLTRFGISLTLGLVFGLTYSGAEYSSYSGINSGMGMMYLSMGFLGIASFNGIIPAAAEERAVFYRERAAQTYNAFWYFFASSVVEIPFVIVSVLLFMGPFFPMVGFTGAGIFFAVSSVLILHVLLQAYIGELLVFSMPNMEIAEIVGMQISLTSFLFMGYSPPASSLPTGWKWLYHIVPLKYSLAAQSAIVFGDCPSDGDSIGCKQITNLPPTLPVGITVKKYLESKFLIKHSEIWTNCAALIGFILLMRIPTLVSMRLLTIRKDRQASHSNSANASKQTTL